MRRALGTTTALAAAIASTSIGPAAYAVEVERTDASFADKRYTFEMVATLDAPIDRVEAVLRDYANYPKLDQRILEAKILDRPGPNTVTLFTSLRACAGPFCRTVKRTERVEEEVHELRATAIPERSDVAFSETFSQLSNAGKRTRVVYRTTISPDFWVPRFVGRKAMLNTLRDVTLNLFGNVEKEASAVLQLPPDCLPHGDCPTPAPDATIRSTAAAAAPESPPSN
jgi:hypothetical protein